MKSPYRIADIHSITQRNGERAPLRDRGRDGRLEKVHLALRWPLRLRGLFVNTRRGLAGAQWPEKRIRKKGVLDTTAEYYPGNNESLGISALEVV
jgi:hypothetical protein